MTVHLQRQIEVLKRSILELGWLVEQQVEKAIRAAQTRDEALAREVIESDDRIDAAEVNIEEECLHTLALHQPVAFDLRYVVAVLKINSDLERMADQAVNIGKLAVFLANEPELDLLPYDLGGEAAKVRHMLRSSLESLVSLNVSTAEEVIRLDDDVDRIHREAYGRVERAIMDRPDRTPQLIQMMSLSRNLERIADLACNIAEDVLYLVRGDITRHRHADGPGAADLSASGEDTPAGR